MTHFSEHSLIAGADIANATGTTAAVNTVTYCLTQQNSTYSTGTGMINNQNPIFVNAADPDGADNIHRTADDGLQIQASSPCINIGNNASVVVATDITGADLIQDTAVDLGAYERMPITCGKKLPKLAVQLNLIYNNLGQNRLRWDK